MGSEARDFLHRLEDLGMSVCVRRDDKFIPITEINLDYELLLGDFFGNLEGEDLETFKKLEEDAK